MNDGDCCAILFTGDANFSESELVDRLMELFCDDNIEIIPGISSIQLLQQNPRYLLTRRILSPFM